MSRSTFLFHQHAEAVLGHELRRARGRLGALPRERRHAVEELTAQVTAALVDGVLEHARSDPCLAQALVSIYGAQPSELTAVAWAAD